MTKNFMSAVATFTERYMMVFHRRAEDDQDERPRILTEWRQLDNDRWNKSALTHGRNSIQLQPWWQASIWSLNVTPPSKSQEGRLSRGAAGGRGSPRWS